MTNKKILLVVFFFTLFVFQQVQAGATIPSVENPSQINLAPANAPLDHIWVYVLHLEDNGEATSPRTQCWFGDTNHGCAEIGGYTYQPNPVYIDIENDYLPDVLAREMDVAVNYPTVQALKAQALSSRTVATWKAITPGQYDGQADYINNSTQYQVFIPGAYEYYKNPNDEATAQQIQGWISEAIASTNGQYLSYQGNGNTIDAEFGADFVGQSVQEGSKDYLISIQDPISTTCARGGIYNGWGMSSAGVIRWSRGNQCATGTVAASDANWVICLYLERRGSDYRLSLCGEGNNNTWIENRYVYITDDWQAIEIEWQAASAPGANNGYMKLFINDVLADVMKNLNNDARSITEVNLGVDGIPAGTTGTVYFDDFESHRNTHIGLDPNGPAVQPPLTELIFHDDFETGDLLSWDDAATGNGKLSASTASMMFGSYGMQVVITDTTDLWAEDWSPKNETHYSARFYFDPNSISIPALRGFVIFASWGGGTGEGFQLKLYNIGGEYKLRAETQNDAQVWLRNQDIPLSDASQLIEVEFQAASATGVNDGYLKVWVNDALLNTIPNVDNDTQWIGGIDLGSFGIPAGTSGTIYFDNFESRLGGAYWTVIVRLHQSS